MAPRRQRPTSEPALQAFGRQMKRYRENANVVQQAIAAHTNTSVSYVSLIETGKRRCKREFVETVDRMTRANGALLELWDDLNHDGRPVPLWFDWPAVEQEAAELITWQHTVIPGLLQTPDYARVLLRDHDEQAVDVRIERQAILTRDKPPPTMLVALLSEAVLTYPVGTAEIMRAQLEHLITMSERPNVTIQIVPHGGPPAGTGGAFVLATMQDRSEAAYLETTVRGITSDDRQDLAGLSKTLMSLRAKALPESMSLDVIRKAIEEL
ncbi:helix-turn-helix domain-containing protein [Actinomadura kijaniata]|uniref:helix-turn-helix domain-containing protein n=1 Tax=Actinomadura kijaniata TaxID=46161 RepID=UPI003F1CC062